MYRLIFTTMDRRQAKRLTAEAKRIGGISLDWSGEAAVPTSRTQIRERAAQVYADYASGVAGAEVAARYGISPQTVSRIVRDPKRYGIQGKPIIRGATP